VTALYSPASFPPDIGRLRRLLTSNHVQTFPFLKLKTWLKRVFFRGGHDLRRGLGDRVEIVN